MRAQARWFAIAVLLWMAQCNSFAGIDHGTPRDFEGCLTLADCHDALPECRTAIACAGWRCVFNDAPEGTPLSAQQSGDCVELVCDGAGRSKPLAAVADLPYDGDPCTSDECDGTTPRHIVRTELPCYTGPEWTRGVGRCAAGIQHCAGGSPTSGCEGEVLPVAEICDGTLNDEDCDGQVNEEGAGCACVPGEVTSCYAGPAGTEGIGICHGGLRGCGPDGISYGPCVGEEQWPEPESCDALMLDEDCDGHVNEEGAACVCIPGEVMSCYTGPAGTGGIGICHASVRTCEADGTAYGPCGAEQTPEPETCDALSLDEDCDGEVNESGPDCTCGDGYLSTGEGCDDGNTLDGDGCLSTCQPAIVAIAGGYAHHCAMLHDGQVKCWGGNNLGRLGLGDTSDRGDEPGEMGSTLPAVDLGAVTKPFAISAGLNHTCALFYKSAIKCWGYNDNGQLGIGDLMSRGSSPSHMGAALPAVNLGTGKAPVAITAGFYHTCALLGDGIVKCWGRNAAGQLGLGDQMARGGAPGEMGDALPAVDLGAGQAALAIQAGAYYTCALLDSGTIKCWGDNAAGQLGLGDGAARGDSPGEMGNALPAVNLDPGYTAIALAMGNYHSCALLEGGSMKCWGYNQFGQLGLGDTNNRGDEPGEMPGEMGVALPAVDLGSQNAGTQNRKVRAIAASGNHTCALLEDGRLKCWGQNGIGQLGLGDVQHRGDYAGDMGDSLPAISLGSEKRVIAVQLGSFHSCALLHDGRLKCWGSNAFGQLGLGDVQNRGDNPNEMDGSLPAVMLW